MVPEVVDLRCFLGIFNHKIKFKNGENLCLFSVFFFFFYTFFDIKLNDLNDRTNGRNPVSDGIIKHLLVFSYFQGCVLKKRRKRLGVAF